MTTNDEPQSDPTYSPLVADVFTAMFRESEATTNRLFDVKDREIAALQKNYIALWEAIENANLKVDSLRIDIILGDHRSRISHAYDALHSPRS